MAEPIQADFIHLINQNLGIAHKVCRVYLMDDEDRKDVLQEMMYQLWRSYPKFNNRSKFSTWMYSVCINTALNYRRTHKNGRTESLSIAAYDVEDKPSENREETISRLFEAIAQLTDLNKAIVLLYLDNLSYEEIAEITGLTKTNVSVRLVRIKRELELLFKEKN